MKSTVEPGCRPDLPRAALRQAVVALRRHHRSESFPTRLHVGRIEQSRPGVGLWVPEGGGDLGLRIDVATRLLDDSPGEGLGTVSRSQLWVTRSGTPEPDSQDLLWDTAVRFAAGQLGLPPPPLWVLTRFGWSDPRSGALQRWTRSWR